MTFVGCSFYARTNDASFSFLSLLFALFLRLEHVRRCAIVCAVAAPIAAAAAVAATSTVAAMMTNINVAASDVVLGSDVRRREDGRGRGA